MLQPLSPMLQTVGFCIQAFPFFKLRSLSCCKLAEPGCEGGVCRHSKLGSGNKMLFGLSAKPDRQVYLLLPAQGGEGMSGSSKYFHEKCQMSGSMSDSWLLVL